MRRLVELGVDVNSAPVKEGSAGQSVLGSALFGLEYLSCWQQMEGAVDDSSVRLSFDRWIPVLHYLIREPAVDPTREDPTKLGSDFRRLIETLRLKEMHRTEQENSPQPVREQKQIFELFVALVEHSVDERKFLDSFWDNAHGFRGPNDDCLLFIQRGVDRFAMDIQSHGQIERACESNPGIAQLVKEQRERYAVLSLVDNGAAVEKLQEAGHSMCHSAVDKEGRGLLHLAAARDDEAVCSWLVDEAKVDISLRDNKGRTASQIAHISGASQVHEPHP